MKIKSLALICLVALFVVYGFSAVLTSYSPESMGEVTPEDRGPHPRKSLSPALIVEGGDITPQGRGPHPKK